MIAVAISQRVTQEPRTGERRDCLDQNWVRFLARCGILPLPVPNVPEGLESRIDAVPVRGVLLTGGNDLGAFGGDAPERDDTEARLIAMARVRRLPLLGICRGMQMIQHSFGVPFERIEGHVTPDQTIRIGSESDSVNSYHDFGTTKTVAELEVWARAEDGVVKAVRHVSEPIQGFMWHPERFEPFRQRDIAFVSGFFGGAPGAVGQNAA